MSLLDEFHSDAEVDIICDVARAAAEAALESLEIKISGLPQGMRLAALLLALTALEAKSIALASILPELKTVRDSIFESLVAAETKAASQVDFLHF